MRCTSASTLRSTRSAAGPAETLPEALSMSLAWQKHAKASWRRCAATQLFALRRTSATEDILGAPSSCALRPALHLNASSHPRTPPRAPAPTAPALSLARERRISRGILSTANDSNGYCVLQCLRKGFFILTLTHRSLAQSMQSSLIAFGHTKIPGTITGTFVYRSVRKFGSLAFSFTFSIFNFTPRGVCFHFFPWHAVFQGSPLR